MKEKLLARVPETVINQPHLSQRQRWTGEYNVACWLRLQNPCPGQINLIVRYTDHEGMKTSIVDSTITDFATTLLLSSKKMISAVGKIVDMDVLLQMDDNCAPIVIDELYLQSCCGAVQGREVKLISATGTK